MEEQSLQDIQLEIAGLVRNEIKAQLAKPRDVKGYYGKLKPLSGAYSLGAKKIDNTGVLSASVQVYFKEDENQNPQMIVDFGQTDYWYYIDQGRLPNNKYPPIDKIKQWIRQKPAMTGLSQLSIDQRAFLAARSIAKDGMYPNNFIEKAMDNVLVNVEARFEEYAMAVVLDAIDNMKTIPKPKNK